MKIIDFIFYSNKHKHSNTSYAALKNQVSSGIVDMIFEKNIFIKLIITISNTTVSVS